MTQAIFLSYASQDADAARRICEALRAAGLEVWFDQSELRGGDAWDASIRKQIKECALFVPMISDNTNAREEGYFRLEWKLAVDRSHLMADHKAFFVPVILGDISEPAALVPDVFRSRQWSRLNDEYAVANFAAHIAKLLARSGSPASSVQNAPPNHEMAPMGDLRSAAAAPARWKRNWLPAVALMIAVVALIAGGTTWLMRKPAPVADATTASSSSEVKALVAQVEGLIRDPMTATRENYVLADELMQRVLKLDSNHADYWVLAARVSMRLALQNYDRSAERRQKATEQVDRALKLAPSSLAAKAVQVQRENYYGSEAEAETMAREILARDPSNRDALAVKLSIARQQGRDSDADALRARLMQLPGGDPLSLLFDTLRLGRREQLNAAEKSFEELLMLSPTRIVYTVGLELKKDYFLDAQSAVDFIGRIPEKLRSEDAIAAHSALALIFVGRGADAVATLNRLPRDYISEFLFNLPKGQIAGLAHEVAGQPAAAALEWRNALSLVEKRLAAEPSNLVLLGNKAQLQAMLGQKAAALETLQLHIELGGKDNPPSLAGRVRVLVRCGRADEAVSVIEREWPNASFVRRNFLIGDLLFLPEYATFRKDKRIAPLIGAQQALVKAARATPRAKP